eukprot:TRINITY_DN33964_c0_g1_i4.p1 TRINITY_DN33964_c0_g1~~TRINITY_DN33964_c0_g1_i4.p1  ORF type:complete len:206 (-),score=31.24 TRINITY_DN33964_c0_g1_i4:426-1043(-)
MALSGTRNSHHMAEDLEVQENASRLTEEELEELAAIGPPRFSPADSVKATFENRFKEDVSVYWLQPNTDTEVFNTVVVGGKTTELNTFHTHRFVLKKGNDIVKIWEADRELGASQHVLVDGTLPVKFKNVGQETLHVFWQQQPGRSGEDVLVGVVTPGQALEMTTHLGHQFIAKRPDGQALSTWAAATYPRGREVVKIGIPSEEL